MTLKTCKQNIPEVKNKGKKKKTENQIRISKNWGIIAQGVTYTERKEWRKYLK
jgi:hypothetical protein